MSDTNDTNPPTTQSDTPDQPIVIQRNPVTSSRIESIGWDEKTSTLEIEFKGGAVYRYDAVPLNVWVSFMEAPSKGSYFHNNIRGVYSYKKQ